MNRRVASVSLFAFTLVGIVAAVGPVRDAKAGEHHETGGVPGEVGSHGDNPAHIWIAVGAGKAGEVTSGGRFHDACSRIPPTTGPMVCNAARNGDWDMDIDGTGAVGLSADFAGWSLPLTLDPTKNISIQGRIIDFDQNADQACQWQKIGILVTWTDIY